MNRVRVVVCSLLLIGAVFSADYPVTVTDALGREVTLEAAPERIVTMIPSHTETVCAVEACDLLVGVDQFSDHPAEVEELPRFGSAFSPNVEGLVEAEPDLVLVDESSGIAETLANLDLVVYAGTPDTYEGVLEHVRLTGTLVARETEAERLADRMASEVEEVENAVAGLPRPSVYYELDDTPYSVGPNSFIGELLNKAGGDNIVRPDMGDFPQLDPEFVVAQDPEVIILGNAPHGVSADTLEQRAGWDDIEAVRRGDVVELHQEQVDIVNRPGPRIAEAVRLFAELLHPDAF